MYHRPKIFLYCLILLQIQPFSTYPTIDKPFPDSRNYLSRNEKQPLFKPPELEETIEEVQRILAQDPSLPRLTRGEIEELYEKVTREEYQKSIAAGDMGRADSMRALMLVLPFNTDNNTEENIQELYTRPPVTKVIGAYTSHPPIKFLTPDPSAPVKTETAPIGNFAATTYKPFYSLKTQKTFAPSPTTYHPPPPAPVIYKMTAPTQHVPIGFQPVTNSAAYETHVERNPTSKPVHRYSSHYSAKNADFLKQRKPMPQTTTVRPVADVLESLGIVGQTQSRNRFTIDDYYPAESAPQPVISTYVPQTVSISDLKELQGYSLSPKIRPDAYASFKPLNIGEEIRVKPEVEDYLTRFGIVGGRKRKDLKKGNNLKGHSVELAAGGSEISTAKLPRRGAVAGSNKPASSELEKLLQNLQELERLNINPKVLTPTTTIRPTTSTTTTTTTPAPTTPDLITNGEPLLIEPKKPRRRIDPNIDINFGSLGNHQTEAPNTDQLSKLLENLQELEKLRTNPNNVLKTIPPATTAAGAARTGALQFAAPTPAPRTGSLVNRFNELALQSTPATRSSAQNDAAQLQQVLRQLQTLEQANARTTKKPQTQPMRAGGGLLAGLGGLGGFGGLGGALAPTDVFNLQKLLTDDRELERLYEQARAKQTGRKVVTTTTPKPTTTTTQRSLILGDLDDADLQRLFEQARARTSTTVAPTTTTTTTTPRTPAPSYRELAQLQKYFAELDRARTSTTTTTTTTTTPVPTTTTSTNPPTTTTTTTTSTSTSTTTTTTPTPALSSTDFAHRITNNLSVLKPKKSDADNDQLQELISRVQQLERLNSAKIENSIRATTTDTPIPFVGFTTRKVNAPNSKYDDNRVLSNDFAHLQELYQQVASAEQGGFGRIEISTAATAAKPSAKRTQNFAQKIIDITNDTGSGSSLQEVDPSDFVQLQKLLSKVQELERVKIHGVQGVLEPASPTPTVSSYTRDFSSLSNLVTSASVHTHTVHNSNGPQIIYPEKALEYKPFENILKPDSQQPNTATTAKSHVAKKGGAVEEPTSSEELRELAMAAPANPKSSTYDKDFEHYQEFFKKLEDDERNSYKNMEPPMIYKTVTKEPPRFIETHKPHEVSKQKSGNVEQKADLEELQKLLSNGQQLEKLGVTLPTELSQQIESKLIEPAHNGQAENQLETSTSKPVHVVMAAHPKSDKEYNDLMSNSGLLQNIAEQKSSSTTLPIIKQDVTFVEHVEEESSEKEAFFSLTTPKSLTPREPKPTTSSTLDLPIFSATKIIEAAIKRAANKIGVSTEQPLGFQRRSDTDIYADMDPGSMDDLMGEFSEMNYQLASPDEIVSTPQSDATVTNSQTEATQQTVAADEPVDITKDLLELQRLIGNLQELQSLNLSVNSDLLRQADAKYLETLKKQQTTADDTIKSRRQSVTPVILAAMSGTGESTTASINTNTDDSDITPDSVDTKAAPSGSSDTTSAPEDSTTTSSSSSTTTTEESRNGSLADLEDSFGGADTNKEEPKPPKRKNGFYFLADWNSFLEVGDGDDQVIVRLSPKIGDPRLFIPVKVP